MAGQTTDSWTRTFTVQAGDHTVVVTEESDGVNPPTLSATVDDLPVRVVVDIQVLIDGITPAIECSADDCGYLAIDDDDLTEHQRLNPAGHAQAQDRRGTPQPPWL
jgi:hypothetical protein